MWARWLGKMAHREGPWLIFQLLLERVDMIDIYMCISQHMNQVTYSKVAYLAKVHRLSASIQILDFRYSRSLHESMPPNTCSLLPNHIMWDVGLEMLLHTIAGPARRGWHACLQHQNLACRTLMNGCTVKSLHVNYGRCFQSFVDD